MFTFCDQKLMRMLLAVCGHVSGHHPFYHLSMVSIVKLKHYNILFFNCIAQSPPTWLELVALVKEGEVKA